MTKGKKHMKKIACVLLAVCLLLSAIPFSAFASDITMVVYYMPENGGYLRLNKYTGSLVGGVNIDGPVTVPTKIEDYDVLSVADAAFQNQTGVTSIVMPDSVTAIGDRAFEGCTAMTSVKLGKNVNTVGNEAFKGCTKLVDVNLPEGLLSLGSYAFSGCVALKSIVIPESIKGVPRHAFSGCVTLSSVTLPKALVSIGEYAFNGCVALQAITLPETLVAIDAAAFYDCEKLEKITIPESLVTLGAYVFANCKSLETVVIKDGLTKIYNYTFMGCDKLAKIEVPPSVTSIAGEAFSGIKGFTIYAIAASYAQVYAAANGIKCVYGTIEDEVPEPPPEELPFIDIEGHWAIEEILWAYETGIVKGKTTELFAPQDNMDRAQFATVLHRMEGEPSAEPAEFEDVRENVYYSIPVGWANANGIILGKTDTLYAPLENISRQQLAVMLFRLAEYKKMDIAAKSDLTAFEDYDDIAKYSLDALSWAVAEKIVRGDDYGNLKPKGDATRAEVCAMLFRFCEKAVEIK